MDYTYFPNDEEKLSYVMRIYEEEIQNRNDWVKLAAENLSEALNNHFSASVVINYAMSMLNHSMMVVRLLDREAIGARRRDGEKEKAEERAKILHERNPELPDPPSSLRAIRNDYEHFEARLDAWATSPDPNAYLDLIVGEVVFIQNASPQDKFRHFVGSTLTFWNREIDLQEVLDWIGKTSEKVAGNNRERF